MGDFTDTDDDNDGWQDIEEPNCGTDPMNALSVPADNDRDGQCISCIRTTTTMA